MKIFKIVLCWNNLLDILVYQLKMIQKKIMLSWIKHK